LAVIAYGNTDLLQTVYHIQIKGVESAHAICKKIYILYISLKSFVWWMGRALVNKEQNFSV
jgi:hypothetical protein